MKKNTLNSIISFLLLILFANAQNKPNVLFVIVDDLGYHDLSMNGSKLYQTPNIDHLANESVSFNQAYSSYPRCVPSRYAIMTGTYPTNEDHGSLGSTLEKQNFIKQFKNEGYTSFYVGKWHLGSENDSPKGFGFDESFAAGDAGGTDSHHYPFNLNRVPGTKGEKAPIEDVQAYAKEGEFLTDALTRRTIDFIKSKKDDKPFIGMLAFYAVHTPIEAKKQDIERNQKELSNINFGVAPEYVKEGNGETKNIQNNPEYAGLVENMDENIGKLIQTLKEQGIYENTIIVITSDHGGLSTRGNNKRIIPTSNKPLRAGKGWIYEGGIKVPLIVHLPNGKSFTENESIILGMDIFPTLTDIALNKTITEIDGKSFKSVIDKKEKWNNRTVYWNSYKARPGQTGDNKTSAIREGDFKLLHFIESNKIELYNIKEDIAETQDLSTKNPEKVKELLAKLNKWKKDKKITMKANKKDKAETAKKEKKKNKKNTDDE